MQPLVQRFSGRATTDFRPPPHRLAIKLVVLVGPPFPAWITPLCTVHFYVFVSFFIQPYHFFCVFLVCCWNPHHQTPRDTSKPPRHHKSFASHPACRSASNNNQTTNLNGGHHETINALSWANHHFELHLRRPDPNTMATERHHRKVWTKQATKVIATRKKFWRHA